MWRPTVIKSTYDKSVELLMEEFIVAKKKRSCARTFFSVLIIFILGIYIGITWNAFSNFKKREIESFDRTLSEEAHSIFLRYTHALNTHTPQPSGYLPGTLTRNTLPKPIRTKLERIAQIEQQRTGQETPYTTIALRD